MSSQRDIADVYQENYRRLARAALDAAPWGEGYRAGVIEGLYRAARHAQDHARCTKLGIPYEPGVPEPEELPDRSELLPTAVLGAEDAVGHSQITFRLNPEFVNKLPPSKQGSYERAGTLRAFAAALRKKPGRWAKYPTPLATNTLYATASRIRKGYVNSFAGGVFEAAVRDETLYVRAVSE
jgi:hypothetical protein